MAEEPPEIGPTQGHAIETQAFMLDLYRLVCMVSADQQAAKYALTSDAIETSEQLSLAPVRSGGARAAWTRLPQLG
jgi:hypothetical protein